MQTYNVYSDMLRQSHILIAGATGSGKSTLLTGLIYTALFSQPAKTQFIFIDCKYGVELSKYSRLPHTIGTACNHSEALNALDYAISIMIQRFEYMRSYGYTLFPGADIYVIVDELADLMTVCKKDTVPKIQRLAQLGRAARVHLIVCTQCPLRSIIPTEIKCNFDCRIALRTATRQDSRNILDIPGAETLPDPRTAGRAEMLYKHSTTIDRVMMFRYSDVDISCMLNYWIA
jgi:S-DNA-T family DNA segregation ATPase FtsK/SpoIIIE